jgi:hypothetical protein
MSASGQKRTFVCVVFRLAKREISYWDVLGPDFPVSQFNLLILLNWCSPSGTAISLILKNIA